MDKIMLVALGGAFGSVMRYLTGVGAKRLLGVTAWPWGTFTANVLGGLLMGMLIGALALKGGDDQERWRITLGVGVLGGYTTFSSFTLEAGLMLERREYLQAFGYIGASVVVALAALFAGLILMRKLLA
jgi:CrcB protein